MRADMPSGDRGQSSFDYFVLQEIYLLEPPDDVHKVLSAVRALPRVRRVEYTAAHKRLLVLGDISAERIVAALREGGWAASGVQPPEQPSPSGTDRVAEVRASDSAAAAIEETPAGDSSNVAEDPPAPQDDTPPYVIPKDTALEDALSEDATPDTVHESDFIEVAAAAEPDAAVISHQATERIVPTIEEVSSEKERPVPSSADTYDPQTSWRVRLAWMAGLSFAMGVALAVLPEAWHVAVGFWGLSLILAGAYPARSALRTLRARRLDANVLVLVAVAGALVLQQWLEAAFVLLLFAVGEAVAARCLSAPYRVAVALEQALPKLATVVDDTNERSMPIGEVAVGQFVRVAAGETVPLDGRIVEGETTLDESRLTGETIPTVKRAGDYAYAGSVNEGEDVVLRVERDASNRRILALIRQLLGADQGTHRFQAVLDRIASRYTPAMTYVAFATAFIPPLVFGEALRDWLYRGVLLLIVAASSSMSLGPRMQLSKAWRQATLAGIIVADIGAFERLAAVRTIVLTPFGVLTQGRWQVSEVLVLGEFTPSVALQLAATLVNGSKEPASQGFVSAARLADLPPLARKDIHGTLVDGVSGTAVRENGEEIDLRLGPLEWLAESGVSVPQAARHEAEAFQAEGKLVVGLATAQGPSLVAMFALGDPLREESRRLVGRIDRIDRRLRTRIVTDADRSRAEWVANQVGVGDVICVSTPQEQATAISAQRAEGETVLLVTHAGKEDEVVAAADIAVCITGDDDEDEVTAPVQILSREVARVPYILSLARRVDRSVALAVGSGIAVKGALLALLLLDQLTLPIAMSLEVAWLVGLAQGGGRWGR